MSDFALDDGKINNHREKKVSGRIVISNDITIVQRFFFLFCNYRLMHDEQQSIVSAYQSVGTYVCTHILLLSDDHRIDLSM